MNNLIDFINRGWNIHIENLTKKIHDENRSGEFKIRVCWKASLCDKYNLESKWSGFETADECVSDLISEIEKLENSIDPSFDDDDVDEGKDFWYFDYDANDLTNDLKYK